MTETKKLSTEERMLLAIFGKGPAQTDAKAKKNPDPAAYEKLKEVFRACTQGLTPREKKVVELRLGLEGGCQKSLEEVAEQYKVTRERIRQIEAKALRKMRHPTRIQVLQGFLESSAPENKGE